MTTAKREYKDTVFRSYFREKENFLALASAVTGETFSPDEARENTVEGVLFHRMRNDVSYSIGRTSLIFFEHQSTWNGNMPLRLLFYLAELYKGIVPHDLIYREQPVSIPAPRFFGFYNGSRDIPEKVSVRLGDAFHGDVKADIELSVTIYNINYLETAALLKACRPIRDYSFFVQMIRENERQGRTRETAIETAMRECVRRGVMKAYLEKHWEEVFSMVSLKWNEADAKASYIAQGMEQGYDEGRASMIYNLLLAGTPIEYIRKASGWTEEAIRKLQQERMN